MGLPSLFHRLVGVPSAKWIRLPGHEVTVSPTWKMPSKGPRVRPRRQRNATTEPVLLKPWCFLRKSGFERIGWEMVCFIYSKVWSQTNLICVNYVVVRFFDKFMIHIIILRYFGQNDLVPSYFQHHCCYPWRSKTEQVTGICWLETLSSKPGI